MKKLALALMAASAAIFGFGMVAEAQTYTTSVSVGPRDAAGGAVHGHLRQLRAGETITFSQPQSTPETTTGVCVGSVTLTGSVVGLLLPAQAASGTATGSFTTAPTAPGTYTVTGTGTTSPARTTTFTIAGSTTTVPATVPGGGLPATGSDGTGTTTGIAIGLLVVGLGLFAVAQVRRRQPSAA